MEHQKILSHFHVVSSSGSKSQCTCPAHEDKQASLTITQGKTSALLFCHAGCGTKDVVQAAGLNMADLFYEEKPTGSSWKAYIERRENRKIEAIYHYISMNGSYAFTKVRLQGKKMLYGRLEKEHFTYGLGGKSRKEFIAVYAPCGIPAIHKAVEEGKPLFLPEGEKDVDTLVKQGYAAAFTYGGASDWLAEIAQLCKGTIVYILADNDEPGRRVANTIYNDLQGVAKCAKIIVPMPDIPHADISDYFAAGHTNEEFENLLKQEAVIEKRIEESIPDLSQQSKRLDIAEVLSKLDYKIEFDSNGKEKSRKLLQTVRNVETVLEEDSRFTGKIKFDEFSQQAYLMGEVPWSQQPNQRAWSSYDDSALFSILQSDYGLNRRPDFFDALKNISMRHSFHPVRELLNSLKWNGENRMRGLLPDYLGAEDSQYTYQVMRLFMVGGVARIFQPGIKFDYTMVFQGPQGIGKSTFLQLLALKSEWFNDSLDSLDSDKAAQSLMGSWIVELAELKALARTGGGTDSIKRFLTAQQDKYRIPYERRADVFPRQDRKSVV